MSKISIVTVCYNAENVIEKTLQSVISQTYKNVEYIIVDGDSSDRTMEIIMCYSSRLSKIVSERDNGIYDAMNKGISLATGDLILFMNAGDTFVDNNVLTNVVEKANDSSDILYGDSILDYGVNKIYYKARFFSKKDINLPFNHQSAFVRLSVAKQNLFNIKYLIAGDYNFFYKLYRNNHKFQYLNFPIANFAMDGISQKYVVKTYKEVREIQGSNSGFNYYHRLLILKIKLLIKRVIPKSLIELFRKKIDI